MYRALQPQDEAAFLRFSVMPDDHRNYALTWFSLAAAVGVLGRRAVSAQKAKVARAAGSA
jgi:cytochrome oxidase assembly protein ShyY1